MSIEEMLEGHGVPAKSAGRPMAPPRIITPLLGSFTTLGLSLASSGVIAMSVPWSILESGGSPGWAAVVTALLHLPVAFGMAVGGSLIDRYGARRLLLGSNALTAFFCGIAVLIAFAIPESPWITVPFLAASNFTGAAGIIAQDTRVPELARLARMPLERANGLRDIAANVGQIGGPAAGVLGVHILGLPGTLAAAVCLMIAIAVMDGVLFPRFRVRAEQRKKPLEIGGLAMVWRDPVLRSTAGIGVVLVAVFTSLDEVLAPNLALASGLGAYALSAFLAMTAAAALIGSALFAAFAARLAKRPILLGGVALMACGLVVLASLPAQVGLAIAPVMIGLGIGPLWPLVVTMIHRRIAVMQRGRVFGSLSAIVMISQPAAALLAGPTVVLVGPHATTVFVAALVVAVAVAAPFVKGLRGLDDRSFGET